MDITTVPDAVERGETITLDAAVENTGGPGSMSVYLFIDETQESVDSEAVELDGGAQTEVSLQYETRSGDPPSVEAIVSPADGGLDDTETIPVEEKAEPQFEITAQSTTSTVAPGETTRLSLALSNTGDAAGAINVFFQAATDATNHNADYYGDDFTVVARDDDGGDWTDEGWSWTDVGPDKSRSPSVELEVAESLNPGEYTFAVTARSNDGSPDDSATATVSVEDSTVSVQPTDLRLVQTAEHTRREQYEDIVSRSALEKEGTLPEWAPDTELVARKETVPLFDLELSETDVDQSLETAIDVSISWGQSGPDDQSFTLRPEFVSSVLDDTTAVSSVLEGFVDGLPRPGADGETYPVFELPADISDVSITVSPHSDDITGKTASLTGVSSVETESLNIGMVLLSDTEDATQYNEVAPDEFEQEATKQREEIERLFPASTANINILTEAVALKSTRLRELLPSWDYRERHQRLAWEYAREELGEAIDAVVAFSPPNFLSDNSEAGERGLTTVAEYEQAVLVDLGLADTTTAAHELTHYFLDTYTAETEYEAEDDDGDNDGAHMTSDVVSTSIELDAKNEIPLDEAYPEFDNFATPDSYMQRNSFSTAGPDTITAQALLDNARDGGFTCAWGTPGETSGTVVSVSASVSAEGIDTHSTRQSTVLSPSTDPDGDAEATIQDANGDAVDSLGLSTTAPETHAMGGDGNCCTSSAAQDETIIRGRIPFPEEAASIVLTAPNPENPDESVSTRVNPVTATFREEIAALSDAQFGGGVNPETTRQSYLDRLDSATTALDTADYDAAKNHFQTLRGHIETEVRSDYEPPVGIPSQQNLLDEIDDRLSRIDRFQEDDSRSPDEPTVADYANENGIVDIDGLRAAIDDFVVETIGIDLLRTVIDAFVEGDPVK